MQVSFFDVRMQKECIDAPSRVKKKRRLDDDTNDDQCASPWLRILLEPNDVLKHVHPPSASLMGFMGFQNSREKKPM